MTHEAVVMAILRGLVAEDPSVRDRSADEVTDVVRELNPDEVGVLAHLLVSVRIAEADSAAQEAQLHALAELAEWHQLPPAVLARISEVPQHSLTGSEVEYLDYLRSRNPPDPA